MIVILDLETQELIPKNKDLSHLRISVAGAKCDGQTYYFQEENLQELFSLLDAASLIVGHNLLLFDYKVLQQYALFDVVARYKSKTFDIFHILLTKTDRQISLNDLAARNLGIQKLGSGKDAPILFKEGKQEELQAYLEQDLVITYRLFEHIRQHGVLKYGHLTYKEPVEREITIVLSA